MKAYELLYFVAPNIDEDTRANVSKRIETAVAQGNGTIDNVDNWGKRKLAYEINGLTDGDYTLVDFHADPAAVAELDRVLRITDAVVRHMIVKRTDRDKITQGPATMSQMRDHEHQQGSYRQISDERRAGSVVGDERCGDCDHRLRLRRRVSPYVRHQVAVGSLVGASGSATGRSAARSR